MGPEDPAADACVALVISGCSEVAKLINENVQGSDRICGAIGACGGSEAGASEAVGGVFEEGAGDGGGGGTNAPPQVYAEFVRKVPAHP
jgi:hypothetical protein